MDFPPPPEPPGDTPWSSAVRPPPAWPGGPPMPPGGYSPVERGRPGMAVAALVLGIVGILLCFVFIPSLLALIFGLVAAKQIKASNGWLGGGSMARAGWILGLVGLVIGAGLIVAAALTVDDDKAFTDLEIGNCLDVSALPDKGAITTIPTIDCNELHEGEVFLTGELNPDRDRDYPGEAAAQQQVGERCSGNAFEEYVGSSYADSEFDVYFVYPQKVGWRKSRGEFLCIVYSLDGKVLDGSVRDSGR